MIEVKNVTKSYGNGESRSQVLRGISFEIKDGDFVVILGASGSGKSTLLNVVSGLERPDGGEVSYGGRDITSLSDDLLTRFRKENVGFVFRQYYLLPHMDVDGNVRMGADLADNRDYRAVIEAVGLGGSCINIPVSFPAASSRGFLSRGRWRKSPGSCSLTSRRAHWMSGRADRCWTMSAN